MEIYIGSRLLMMIHVRIILGVTVLIFLQSTADAGICWLEKMSNGNCAKLFSAKDKTFAECCADGGNFFTKKNHEFESLFRFSISKVGVPNCLSCDAVNDTQASKSSFNKRLDRCSGIDCGHDKICKVRRNVAMCYCKRPRCKDRPATYMCGTDSKTYRNECSLRRQACIKSSVVSVSYNGVCRDNCKNVVCRDGKSCVVDQYNKSHCVSSCSNLCISSNKNSIVCGADGITYNSYCELRIATCKLGKTIGIAYMGICKVGSNCSTISCTSDKKCLTDDSGNPRCVSCKSHCLNMDNITLSGSSDDSAADGLLCGTDGKIYSSYCALRKYGCKIGRHIDIMHRGACARKHNTTSKPFLRNIGARVIVTKTQSDGRLQQARNNSEVLKFLETASFTMNDLIRALFRLGLNVKMTNTSKPQDRRKSVVLKSFICRLFPSKAPKEISCN